MRRRTSRSSFLSTCLTAGLLLPALLALGLALSGCRPEESRYGGTLVLSTLDEPQHLNPLYYLDTASPNIGSLVFSSLVTLNERLEFVPELAESWEVSEDGTVWDFYLRQGVRFHDGRELSARDVLFTFRSILDPANQSSLASFYAIIADMEAPDPYRVRFRLKEPYSPFFVLLAQEIVPAHAFLERGAGFEEFGRSPIGTGPFRFESWEQGRITLAANEEYFEGRPYLDRMVVQSYPDRGRAWSALMQGEADVVTDLDLEDYRVLENDPRFRTYSYLDVFYHTLLFNLRDPLFAEPRMREAIDLAIDREDLIENALHGWGVQTTGPFRPGTWPYNPEVPESRYDPEGASRLLAFLGWEDVDGDLVLEKNGQELTFTILADRGDLLKEAAAQRIKWQLFRVGVRAEVQLLEQQDLFREHLFPGRFQTVLLQFNASIDPDKYTSFFWHSSRIGSSNLGAYADPEVDRLIERGRVSVDFEERQQIYRRIHLLMARDRPAVFLYVRQIYLGTSSRFQGIKAAPELFYLSIKDWHLVKNQVERR